MRDIIEGLTSPPNASPRGGPDGGGENAPTLAWTGIRSPDRSARVRAELPKEFRQVHERTRITGGPELRFEIAIRTGSCDAEMVFPKRTPSDGFHRLYRPESKCRTARYTVNNLTEQQDASLFMVPLPRRTAARAHRTMLLLSTVKQLFCGC
jgi:hypothetical protein